MSPAQASSPEAPWPVAEVNTKIKSWVERLGSVWVEGQIAQLNMKPSWRFSYITLRDPEREASLSLICPSELLASMPHVKDGDRVIVCGKPSFYVNRGTLSLQVTDIRQVGIGELLARIERLRSQLAHEGLTAAERKKPLPFLPKCIGLITGRGSAAERDVLAVSHDRWPGVSFRVINTAVQGARAVPEVIEALQALEADPEVDVIIIARGGGSVEDLLPFSEEALARAVAACQTPVVSAIGHEPDHPVLDDVADVRAATPTDAAKRVVPDVAIERQRLGEAKDRLVGGLRNWVARERDVVKQLKNRPVLADPMSPIVRAREEVGQARAQLVRLVDWQIKSQQQLVAGLRAQVSSLGPSATLARGYAIVQVVDRETKEMDVVMSYTQAPPGSQLRIRVGDGHIVAAGMSAKAAD